MDESTRGLLKAILFLSPKKETTKKLTGVAVNFVSRGALIPYFKFKASLFCCPFFFEEYRIRQVRINK